MQQGDLVHDIALPRREELVPLPSVTFDSLLELERPGGFGLWKNGHRGGGPKPPEKGTLAWQLWRKKVAAAVLFANGMGPVAALEHVSYPKEKGKDKYGTARGKTFRKLKERLMSMPGAAGVKIPDDVMLSVALAEMDAADLEGLEDCLLQKQEPAGDGVAAAGSTSPPTLPTLPTGGGGSRPREGGSPAPAAKAARKARTRAELKAELAKAKAELAQARRPDPDGGLPPPGMRRNLDSSSSMLSAISMPPELDIIPPNWKAPWHDLVLRAAPLGLQISPENM